MRFHGWYKATQAGWPLVVLTMLSGPVSGQFREVSPQEPTTIAPRARELSPTTQTFVPPKRTESASSPANSSAAPANVEPAAGEPTLATPPGQPTTPAVSAPVVPPASNGPAPTETPPALGPSLSVPAAALDPFTAFRRALTGHLADAAPAPTALPLIAPLTFNQITPGQSTVVDVETLWGAAAKTVADGSGKRLIYRAPGFRQVDLTTDADAATIRSILVHLTQPLAADDLVEHLQLSAVRPVEILEDEGAALGRGYPERGVLMLYESSTGTPLVSHLSLEPVHGELYRLRAEADRDHRYTDALADLEEACRLNPQDAKSYWLQAEIFSSVGRTHDAIQSASESLRVAPDHPLYQLTRARLAAGNGELTDAVSVTQTLADNTQVPAIVRARAYYQLGNLLAMGTAPKMQEALNHHLKAIELAGKHAGASHVEVRRMAKDILVDAHLAVAQDIALGNFQRQRDVVPKWLTRATELAEKFITDDAADESMRMEIYRTTLAVYSVLDGNFDASIATEEAIKEGQRLVAAAADRQYQYQIERELSETLYHAAKIEHRCGRAATALKYANNAIALLEGGTANSQPSLFDQLMAGQLYYFAGSLYALQQQDHVEAGKLYDKSLPAFNDERLVGLVDCSVFGDLFVSMGVSFWETGDRDKAIELTQAGAQLMQQGIASGTIDELALSVPYGNLAAMYEQLGDAAKAQEYSTLMARAEKAGEPATTQR